MQDGSITIPTKKKNRTYTYLSLLNPILGLTLREMEILAALIDEGGLSTSAKKRVSRDLGVSNIATYVKKYKERGIIQSDNQANWYIQDFFFPKEEVKFRLNIKDEQE